MNDNPEKTGVWYIISSCLLLILFRAFVIEVSFEIYFVLVECGFLSFHGDLRPRWLCYESRRGARGPRRLGNASLGYISGNWCQIFSKKKKRS